MEMLYPWLGVFWKKNDPKAVRGKTYKPYLGEMDLYCATAGNDHKTLKEGNYA